MPSKLRRSLRPPSAYEALALVLAFLALGGGSYAAITVTGRNVKNSSLTGKDVKNNSLTGADIKAIKSGDVTNGSLLAQDFKAGQLPAGPRGLTGATGAPGTARAYAHVAANGTLDTSKSKGVDRVFEFEPGGYCVNFSFGVPNSIVVTTDGTFGQTGAVSGANSCNLSGVTYNAQVYMGTASGSQSPAPFFVLAN